MRCNFLKLSFIVSVLLFIFSVPASFAQEMSSSADSQHSTGLPSDKLFLDFKGATLINVLQILSELTGINFVAGKEVAAREVNMVLEDATLEDVLEALARGSNVVSEFIPDRRIYLFRASADPESSPLLITRVFKLYYLRASKLREISGSSGSSSGGSGGSSSGGGSSSSGGSSLSLTETEEEADSSSPIVTIIENMLSERGKVSVDSRSNSLVVTDTEDRVRMAEQVIAGLDRPLDQVLIRLYLVELFEDLDRFLGVDWTNSDEGNIYTLSGATGPTHRFPYDLLDSKFFRKLGADNLADKSKIAESAGSPGTQSFGDLDITVKVLQTANKLKVIAKPKILVLDNHPALIKITTDAAIGSNAVTTATGQLSSAQTTTTERAEIGTAVRLTPLINTNNRITLTVEPSFATVSDSTIDVGSGTGDVTRRTARTTLMLNNGQTVVLGGLLQSSQTQSSKKVPVAADIPFLGELFTRRGRVIEDRELALFVTPHIVHDPSEVQSVSIPDERARLNDEEAPFWKVKRKQWYKDMMQEKSQLAPDTIENQFIEARGQVMDDALKTYASELQPQEIEIKVT